LKKLFYIVSVLLLLVFNIVKSQNLYILNNEEYNNKVAFYHFEDSSDVINYNDLVSLAPFKELNEENANLAYSSSAHWFSFQYKTDSENQYYLLIENPLLDTLEIFFMQKDNLLKKYFSGDISSFQTREIDHNDFIISLPKVADTITVLIKVKCAISVLIPASILSEKQLLATTNEISLGLGIYYGAILVMLLYSLFLFQRLKDYAYLFYVCYLFTYGMSLLTFDGISFKYINQNNPDWNNLQLYFFIYLATIFGVLFTISFLNLKHTWNLGYRLITIFLFPVVLSTLLLFFYQNLTFHDIASSLLASLLSFIGISVGIGSWIKGNKSAKYYFFAFTFVLSSIIIYVFKDLGIIASNSFTENIMHYGSGIEMVLLSLGLADKYNRLKEENSIAQQKIIDNLEEIQKTKERANKELEEKVIERTAQVNTQKALIELKNKEVTDSITYASRIQRALLPSAESFNSHFKSFVLFMPKDIVSGDFYWVSQKYANNDYFMYAIADCTGHGVPGGFMSMLGMSYLNEIVDEKDINDPGEVLNLLRTKVINALKQEDKELKSQDGMDIVLILINKKTLEMKYAAANNTFYIVKSSKLKVESSETTNIEPSTFNLQLEELPCDKMPVGTYYGEEKPFKTYNYQLNKGDIIYTFTDGYADQFGGELGEKYTYKRLREKLINVSNEQMELQKKSMKIEFKNWLGSEEQIDDVCLIGNLIE
jgi:two-component system, sensor histidine kinase LadS